MFLTDQEIEKLTEKKRRPAQSRVLSFMGIDHKLRPDGSIVVLRAHIEKLFGASINSEKPKRKTEPDFSKVK